MVESSLTIIKVINDLCIFRHLVVKTCHEKQMFSKKATVDREGRICAMEDDLCHEGFVL